MVHVRMSLAIGAPKERAVTRAIQYRLQSKERTASGVRTSDLRLRVADNNKKLQILFYGRIKH